MKTKTAVKPKLNGTFGRLAESLSKETRKEALWCYLMIAFPLIGFLVFKIYPILWTFRWSFFSYNMVPSQTKFVGLDNFIRMFSVDFTYWRVWLTTFEIAALKMLFEIPVAMLLALILQQGTKGAGFFRSMYYLPNVISVAIVGLVFSNIFNYTGLINTGLMRLGVIAQEMDWYSGRPTAIAMLVAVSIWCSIGVNVIYFVAALANVSKDVYESAYLDGASKGVVFFKITLPMIFPVFKIVLMLSLLGSLSINELVLVLTGGGPSGGTLTVMSYLTRKFVPGFMETATPQLGYGCAMSLVTTILFAVIGLSYNKLSERFQS